MAKERYKIPTTLDVSYFDMEFNLKTKDGLGVNAPITAKVLLAALVAIFGWFYLIFNSFMSNGSILVKIGFTIVWLLLSIILVKADKTGRMGFELLLSMLNYLPKHGRIVPTRMGDNIRPLQKLTNIKTIDPEDGMIRYLDGQIGYVYHIVGSASHLMFEEDKRMILDRVDGFYRRLPVGLEIIYDTVYEGHVVDDQIRSVENDMANLISDSQGLQLLQREQYNVLKYAINDEQGITSLHQYLVVRSPNKTSFREFENILFGDVEGEGLMFRLARTLTYEETLKYFKSVMGGVTISATRKRRK